MYSLDEIKEIISILEKSELAVMEITDESGSSLHLEKPVPTSPLNTFAVNAGNLPAVPTAAQQDFQSAPVPQSNAQGNTDNSRAIKSPMVGVFYAASSPESSPFVTVGQKVQKGDVVCIIEAMKLMNEITAEQSGTVTEICVNNGDIVEFDQPLFKIN